MNLFKFLIPIFVFALLAAPAFAALTPLVPCDGVEEKCDFNAFMKLINNIITFILFGLALPVAAVMFAWAGILLLTSGGSTEARGRAKNIFMNTALGLIIAAAAWLIVNTILSILVKPENVNWIGFS